MIDLDTIPDPPERLAEFRAADWPTLPGGLPVYDATAEAFTGQLHRSSPELKAREEWRRAREQWAAENGLPWTEAEQVLARARARLRARRAAQWQPEQPAERLDSLHSEQRTQQPHHKPQPQPMEPRAGAVLVDPQEPHPGLVETPGGRPPSRSSAIPRSTAARPVYGSGTSGPDTPESAGEQS
jgi:hypothetical protein